VLFRSDLLAHRAGVGKATIYRRWESKETLILDALRMTTTPIPVPDEGSVRDDLLAYMDAVIERFSPGRGSDVLPHLIEASCYDDQLRASLDEYLRERQATTRMILHRAIERGQLPADTDVDLITDVILAPFFYRHLLTGAPVDRDFTHRLVDFALR
jgi:AcrR family transcriptional regulator